MTSISTLKFAEEIRGEAGLGRDVDYFEEKTFNGYNYDQLLQVDLSLIVFKVAWNK